MKLYIYNALPPVAHALVGLLAQTYAYAYAQA
jgi:hypothetical protein